MTDDERKLLTEIAFCLGALLARDTETEMLGVSLQSIADRFKDQAVPVLMRLVHNAVTTQEKPDAEVRSSEGVQLD